MRLFALMRAFAWRSNSDLDAARDLADGEDSASLRRDTDGVDDCTFVVTCFAAETRELDLWLRIDRLAEVVFGDGDICRFLSLELVFAQRLVTLAGCCRDSDDLRGDRVD